MSTPEGINLPNDDPADSEQLMNEYLRTVESQKLRISSVYKIRDKINNLMSLMLAGDGQGTEDAARDLERYTHQCRFFDPDFMFEVRNLPPESYVLEINSYRMAEEGEEETFVANDIAVRGDVINLLNHQRRIRVQLFPFEGKIEAMAMFEGTLEEE